MSATDILSFVQRMPLCTRRHVCARPRVCTCTHHAVKEGGGGGNIRAAAHRVQVHGVAAVVDADGLEAVPRSDLSHPLVARQGSGSVARHLNLFF